LFQKHCKNTRIQRLNLAEVGQQNEIIQSYRIRPLIDQILHRHAIYHIPKEGTRHISFLAENNVLQLYGSNNSNHSIWVMGNFHQVGTVIEQ
jgi:hypothetical protein